MVLKRIRLGPVFIQSGEFNYHGRKAQQPAPLNQAFSFNWGGDKEFVMATKAKLRAKVLGRGELENNGGYELKEPQNPYNRDFDPEKCSLRLKNDHIWQIS